MEAKNPYRTKERPNNVYATIYERGFKAGQEQHEKEFVDGLDELAKLAQLRYKEGKKTGIREVVEWVEQNHTPMVDGWDNKNKLVGMDIVPEDWQAFKKSKGIES